jgi:hypothetical protein
LLPDAKETVVPPSRGLKAFPVLVIHIDPVSIRLEETCVAFLQCRDECVVEPRMDKIPRGCMDIKGTSKPFIVRLAPKKVVGEHDDIIVCRKIRENISPLVLRDEELKIVFEEKDLWESSVACKLENLKMRQRTSMGGCNTCSGWESLHTDPHSSTFTFNFGSAIGSVIQIDIKCVHFYTNTPCL